MASDRPLSGACRGGAEKQRRWSFLRFSSLRLKPKATNSGLSLTRASACRADKLWGELVTCTETLVTWYIVAHAPDLRCRHCADERERLEGLARTGRGRADLARRAHIILPLAAGASYLDIERGLGESSRTIGKWKRRFLEARVEGLEGRYRGNTPPC